MDIKKLVEYLENNEDIDENFKQFLDNDELKKEDIMDEDSSLKMIGNIMDQVDIQNGYDELIELRKNGYNSVESLIEHYINDDKKVEFLLEFSNELDENTKMSIINTLTKDENKLKH